MSGTSVVGWTGADDTLEETRALASDGKVKSKDDAEGADSTAAHRRDLSRWRWLFILCAGGATLLCWALVVYWLGAVTLGAKGADPTARGFSWVTGDKRVFNWHPVLMTGGFVAALGQATLVHSVPANALDKGTRKWVHAVLLALALVLASAGLVAVFRSHNEAVPPIPNMYSAHAWFGMTTFVLFVAQFFFGAFAFGAHGVSATQRAAALPLHRWVGVGIFELAAATAVLGITEKMAFNGTGGAKGAEMQVTNAAAMVLLFAMVALPGAVALRERNGSDNQKPLSLST